MEWTVRIRDRLYVNLAMKEKGGHRHLDGYTKPSRVIVFSPHYDDETLGCGGTIIQMVRAGVTVYLAFMTDGSTSHRHLMAGDELKRIRASEGREAAQCLGINPDHVFLFEIPEGQLEKHSFHAGSKVQGLLSAVTPEAIFIPHAREPLLWSSDHIATHKIVSGALASAARPVVIWEYPIWYWYHWPWVGIDIRDRQQAKIILKNTIRYRAGTSAAYDFNCSISIKPALDEKINALNKHRSQVARLVSDDRWSTLHDMAGGDFVDMFFRGHEFFRRTEISKN
jgi:LmbE family N-acetylglucosaminyl deacetylase